MLLILALLGCPGVPETVTLHVQSFDCERLCWNEDTLDVPGEYWAAWDGSEACDDAGFDMTYGDQCVRTTEICYDDWADDPAIGDGYGCCGGGLDAEAITGAPACSDVGD